MRVKEERVGLASSKVCRRLTAVLLVMYLQTNVSVLVDQTYTKDLGCYSPENYEEVFARGLILKKSQSFLHCIFLCSQSQDCLAAVYDDTNNCSLLLISDYLMSGDGCRLKVDKTLVYITFYRKLKNIYSKNESLTSDKTSDCTMGWSGESCEIAPNMCTDADVSGMFWMEVKLWNAVKVLCDVTTPEHFKIYAFKNDGTRSHNKTWEQYSQGYYIDDNNFWVGLENMRAVIDQNMTNMRLEVAFNSSSYFYYWDYNAVKLSSSLSHYAITYADSKHNNSLNTLQSLFFQNCLTSGKQFSTVDSDNDEDTDDLAAKGNAGWWFDYYDQYNVLLCNPMGRLTNVSFTGRMIFPGLDLGLISTKYVNSFLEVAMYFYK